MYVLAFSGKIKKKTLKMGPKWAKMGKNGYNGPQDPLKCIGHHFNG